MSDIGGRKLTGTNLDKYKMQLIKYNLKKIILHIDVSLW